LKRLCLQFATPNDQPASELLKEIEAS
jgi:hypothetical protein